MSSFPPLTILLEDAHLIAVAKPPGLLTQGFAEGDPTLEQAVRRHLHGNPPDDRQLLPYLGTVHRLDRPVSGIVLWAKTPKATRRLASQFAERTPRKVYHAVAERLPVHNEANEGIWEDWLSSTTEAAGIVTIVEPETLRAKRATTRFKMDRSGFADEHSVLLELRPETGRTHQLRVQAAARGLPVLGDARYGSTRPFPAGIALHAFSLEFEHPTTKGRILLETPPPESWGRYRDPAFFRSSRS